MTREEADRLASLAAPIEDRAYLIGYAKPQVKAHEICSGFDNEKELTRTMIMGQQDSIGDHGPP